MASTLTVGLWGLSSEVRTAVSGPAGSTWVHKRAQLKDERSKARIFLVDMSALSVSVSNSEHVGIAYRHSTLSAGRTCVQCLCYLCFQRY